MRRKILVAAFVLTAGLILFAPIPTRASPAVERHFRIEASQSSFSPAELHVNPGDRVTIELVSQDVVHGLEIDGYGPGVTADPGQPASFSFTAGKPGVHRFRCSVTCGNLHPFVLGKLYVGPNTFIWRAAALLGLAGVAVLSLNRHAK
jgi:heme/copper-type cytochrome/quinol oxidase subunit 2